MEKLTIHIFGYRIQTQIIKKALLTLKQKHLTYAKVQPLLDAIWAEKPDRCYR